MSTVAYSNCRDNLLGDEWGRKLLKVVELPNGSLRSAGRDRTEGKMGRYRTLTTPPSPNAETEKMIAG